MSTVEILLLIIAVILALCTGFLIPLMMEMRRASAQTAQFLKETGDSLNTALKEFGEASRSVRTVADDVNSVTGSAREVSSSFAEAADDVREILERFHKMTARTSGRYAGLRAGIKAGLEVLINSLFDKRGDPK